MPASPVSRATHSASTATVTCASATPIPSPISWRRSIASERCRVAGPDGLIVSSDKIDHDMRIAGLLACATIALMAVATRPAIAVTWQTAQDTPDPGEQIQNLSCATCHDLRPIQTQALDKDGWTRMVASMVEKGADVKAEDVPVLVNYLVKSHGPLPDGPGKAILLNTCTV